MKIFVRLYSILLLLVFCSFSQKVQAQTSILEVFHIENVSGQVLLSWTVKSGYTCNGIGIYRSADSLTFSEIGDIQGVCGNLGFSTGYTFIDDTPLKNQINYYRLDLGGIEVSYTLAVEVIDVGENDFYLKQNPIGTNTYLYFNNASNQSTTLEIIDHNGHLIKAEESNSDKFILNKANFAEGVYFFQISYSDSSDKIRGRFMVVD